MLRDEQASPEQLAIFGRMAPERRLSLAEQLYWSARDLKAAWLRAQHADWTEEGSPWVDWVSGRKTRSALEHKHLRKS